MDPRLQVPPHAWRRLAGAAVLALVLHLLLLWLFGPRLGGAPYASSIVHPIRFTSAPVAAVPAAKPQARRPRPRPVAPPAPSPVAIEPEPRPETPAPAEPEPEPVVEAAARETPDTPVSDAPEAAAAPTSLPLPPGPQVAIPGSQRLKYSIYGEMRRMKYHAGGELLWAHDGADYEARMEVGAFLLGSRVQRSVGRITPEGLEPRRFSDASRRERVAELDHTQAQASFSEGAAPAPLVKGAQDQLSIFVQLASQLAVDPTRYPRGTELALQTVGVKGSDTWHFVVNGEESLDLPGGVQATLKFTRLKQNTDDLGVEIWLAPALGWLPARIRLTQDNGDYIDQQWRGSETP